VISLFLTLALVSSSSPASTAGLPSVVLTATGPALSSASNTFFYPLTNSGVVYSSNYVYGAQVGQIATITWPATYTQTGVENFTPFVAGLVGGSTTWVTSGVFRCRATYNEGGTTHGYALTFPISTTLGTASLNTFSNYVAGSLGAVALAEITTRTNAGRDFSLWSAWATNGWTWNTNSLIYGCTGYTGLSQANSYGWGLTKLTAVTRRHLYTAGHAALPSNTVAYFIGSDGSTNIATGVARLVRYDSGDDYCLILLSNDLPATVDPVCVAWSTNVAAKIPYFTLFTYPRPLLETCQHGQIGSQTMSLSDHVFHVFGDSGNPTLLIVSNTLVNYGGTSGTLLSTNFYNDLNALTTAAGLSTNDYQPILYDLSGFPSY
jgi:hypothetical protein